MPRRKVNTTIYLRRDQLDALKKISEVSNIPMAVLIRDGIDDFLLKKISEVSSIPMAVLVRDGIDDFLKAFGPRWPRGTEQ